MANAGDICRVLVVDDDPSILEDYAHAFDSPGQGQGDKAYADLAAELFGSDNASADNTAPAFELVACSQGLEAIEAVRVAEAAGRPFSVAFVDVRMPPGIDGVKTVEAMQAIDSELNAVIVTGYSDFSRVEIANRLKAGNFFYFQKPFLADEFMQLAWTLHAKRRAERGYRALNASLQSEVERQSGELREALQKALQAAHAKSSFLSNMSHELRTPLNAIIGFSDVIQNERFGAIGETRYVSYAADINNSAQHLLNLINDILDYSKIEAGGMVLSDDIVDLDETIAFATRLLSIRASQKSIELQHARLAQPALISCDERRVKQVLLNLISNAIKFSRDGNRIDISAAIARDIRVTIRDQGIGMTPVQAEKALEPFTQIDGAFTRSQEGTGLGLPISLALMRLHQGDLQIESAPDAGTTVTVTFPVHRLVRPAAQ